VTTQQVFEGHLAEYSSARDEMLGAIANQHLALTFGTASLVGAYAAGFVVWDRSVAGAIFYAIPLLASWILAMWLGEVVRMLRSVGFCAAQARSVNALIGDDDPAAPPALRWEQWRREEKHRTIRWTYWSVGAAMIGASLGGIACGIAAAHHSGWPNAVTWLVAAGLGLYVSGVVVVVLRVQAKWQAEDIGMP
jgi:hypothetical protein